MEEYAAADAARGAKGAKENNPGNVEPYLDCEMRIGLINRMN
jgi:hypothetical protein